MHTLQRKMQKSVSITSENRAQTLNETKKFVGEGARKLENRERAPERLLNAIENSLWFLVLSQRRAGKTLEKADWAPSAKLGQACLSHSLRRTDEKLIAVRPRYSAELE